MTNPAMTARATVGMGAALSTLLRKTFSPVASGVDAEFAALCARIAAIGEDRRGRPFRRHYEHR